MDNEKEVQQEVQLEEKDVKDTKKEEVKVEDDPNTFTFDTTMKKKKKKKKDKSVETPETKDIAAEDPMALFGEKKKKKKKKHVTIDAETPRSGSADEVEMPAFGEKKKKKNKRPDLAEFEAQLMADGGVEELNQEQNEEKKEEGKGEDGWLDSDRDYTYDELLQRVFKILHENNPELVGDKKRYTIAPPQVHREGSRKTIFYNLIDICKRMHRPPEHVIQFLFAELGTSGSIDGSQRLVIKGRFQQKQIENILKRYIMEYVTCKVCKSPDTILVKDNRIFFLNCEACGAVKSVSAIKTGFKAQTEKRSAQRAQQQQ